METITFKQEPDEEKDIFELLHPIVRTWFKNIKDKDKYKKDNYFPKNVDLEFKNFNEFYSKRKEILKEKLKQILT